MKKVVIALAMCFVIAGFAMAHPTPPGPQGEQGIQGEQGTQGDQGVQGEKGDSGEKNAAYGPGLDVVVYQTADINIATMQVTGTPKLFWDESQDRFSLTKGLEIIDGGKIAPTANTTGLYIGGAATDKLSLWGVAPIVQPTTAISAATFVTNTSGIINDTATFDGYTIGQVVKALRNAGLLQ